MIILRRWTDGIKISQLFSQMCKLSKAISSSALPKEERIRLGEHNVNYMKVGAGEHKVLCLPGALGSMWTDFKPQIEGFDRQKFTLIAWDPPGYGKSRPPEKEFPTDFYHKDAQVAIDFMKALNIPKYSILGWSDGGVIGIIQAAKAPDAVRKLVIWGTNSFIQPTELESYKQTRDVRKWSRNMRQPMVEVYGEEYFAEFWAKWCDAMDRVYLANNGDICSQLLKHIKCPTFILYGEKDPMVDKVHVAHLHTNIPNSRIHLYPDGKHNIHLRYADDFNKRVQEYLLLP